MCAANHFSPDRNPLLLSIASEPTFRHSFPTDSSLKVADGLRPWPGTETSIYQMLRQATNLGVSLRACAMAMGALVGPGEALIPEYAGTIAASAFVARALDPDSVPLVL